MPGAKGAKTSGRVFSGRRTTLEYFGSMGEPVLGHQRIFAILVLLLTVNPAFTGYSWSVPPRALGKGFPSSLPVFDTSSSSEVSVELGQAAYLPCVIKNLGDKQVSWIRTKDLQILTSGTVTFTADQRFDILYVPEAQSWTLRIRKSRISDVGKYECQVNTDPKMNKFFNLSISEAPLRDSPLSSSFSTAVKASISGPKQQYVKIGSTVTFECRLYFGGDPQWDRPTRVSTRSVPNVQWLHEGLAISFQAERGGISVETERAERTGSSRLTVASVGLGDAGRYTCTGPAIAPDTVTLHVIEGEHTEAMQRDEARRSSDASCGPFKFSVFLIFSLKVSYAFVQISLLFSIISLCNFHMYNLR